MAEDFYPFVENGTVPNGAEIAEPQTAARIAVYDDMTMPPRVVLVEPTDIRTYLAEITKTTYELVIQHCDQWSFQVIRELVENLIHASFCEPTISILDRGKTLVFSDQGPGIPDKRSALKPSFSSATAGMKRYIRGVGSGLPIVEEWLRMHGGTLFIEDNLGCGTTVTVSLALKTEETPRGGTPGEGSGQATTAAAYQPTAPVGAAAPYPHGNGMPAANPYAQPYANPYAQPSYAQPYMQAYGQAMPPGMPCAPGYPQAGFPPAGGYQTPSGPFGQTYGQPGIAGGEEWAQTYPAPRMSTAGYPTYQEGYNPYSQAYPAAGVPLYGGARPQQPNDGVTPVQSAPTPLGATAPEGGVVGTAEHATGDEQTPRRQPDAAPHMTGIDAHVPLSPEQREIIVLFASVGKVGPKELNAALSIATATGSRKLKELAAAGYIAKNGQKYVLTGEGQRVLSYLTDSEV